MFSDVKRYDQYLPTGVDWLPRRPAHWDLSRGMRFLQQVKAKNADLSETTVLSLSYGRIVVKPQGKLHGLVPASFATYQVLEPGAIVIRPTDLQNDQRSARVGLVRDHGIITSAYLGFEVTGGLTSGYAFGYLSALDSLKVFYGMGSGLRQNLEWADFKRLPMLLPPVSEQGAIVRYLTHANRRIDRAIAAKRKLIRLLEEQKQVIITEAVTRGLDPNVPVRDSGVPWLGDIPAHWEVRRAKYLFSDIDDRSRTGGESRLSVSHLTGVTPSAEKNITMFQAASYVGHKLCKPGDLVVNTMWAWMGALGVAHEAGIVSPAYNVYRPRNPTAVSVEFIAHLLRSGRYVAHFRAESTGVRPSRLRFYPDQMFAMPLVEPPLEEQLRIIAHIREATQGAAAALQSAKREIDLLREFRTRLTADVVTGQVDVREAAASLPDVSSDELAESVDGSMDDEMDEFAEESVEDGALV